MSPKHILLICYGFPPVPGIGGRRWAKFAKYLSRKGHRLQVISAENVHQNKSPWIDDVEGESTIAVHRLPAMFPGILNSIPQNFAEKLAYRLALGKVKRKIKGDFLDRAGLWEKQLTEKATELLQIYNINNVIVSGAPYHLCYFTAKLKNDFPELNLIVDFRDPWTYFNNEWSFGQLEKKRQDEEREMEKYTVEAADHLVTVADSITNKYKTEYGGESTNYLSIPNGYDPEDFERDKTKKNRENDDLIRFVFTGSLYDNLDYLLDPLYDFLLELKSNNAELYQRIRIDFFGNYPNRYQEKVASKGVEAITFHGTVPIQTVYREIRNADFCMLFLIKNYAFSRSTKFYEYASRKKKIVVFSEEGELPEFVVDKKMGYAVYPESFTEDFQKVLDAHGTKEFEKESDFDFTEFSVEKLTDKIEALLK